MHRSDDIKKEVETKTTPRNRLPLISRKSVRTGHFKGGKKAKNLERSGFFRIEEEISSKKEEPGYVESEVWAVKSSLNDAELGQDIAEFFTGFILHRIIGETAVPYEPFRHPGPPNTELTEKLCIRSKVYPQFIKLGDVIDLVFGRPGWIGSNPMLPDNKKNIELLLNEAQKKELSLILSGCALLNDTDCHVDNLCFYGDDTTLEDIKKALENLKKYRRNPSRHEKLRVVITLLQQKRLATFDHGWGLADFCKPKQSRVLLKEGLSPVGRLAGVRGAKPTNHFNDFPFIIEGDDFPSAISSVTANAYYELEDGVVEKAFALLEREIGDSFPEGTHPHTAERPYKEEHKLIYLAFAKHLGLKDLIPFSPAGTSVEFKLFKNNLIKKIKYMLRKRLQFEELQGAWLEVDLEIKKLENALVQARDPISESDQMSLHHNINEKLRKLQFIIARYYSDSLPNDYASQISHELIDKLKMIYKKPFLFRPAHDLKSFFEQIINKRMIDIPLHNKLTTPEQLRFAKQHNVGLAIAETANKLILSCQKTFSDHLKFALHTYNPLTAGFLKRKARFSEYALLKTLKDFIPYVDPKDPNNKAILKYKNLDLPTKIALRMEIINILEYLLKTEIRFSITPSRLEKMVTLLKEELQAEQDLLKDLPSKKREPNVHIMQQFFMDLEKNVQITHKTVKQKLKEKLEDIRLKVAVAPKPLVVPTPSTTPTPSSTIRQ